MFILVGVGGYVWMVCQCTLRWSLNAIASKLTPTVGMRFSCRSELARDGGGAVSTRFRFLRGVERLSQPRYISICYPSPKPGYTTPICGAISPSVVGICCKSTQQ